MFFRTEDGPGLKSNSQGFEIQQQPQPQLPPPNRAMPPAIYQQQAKSYEVDNLGRMREVIPPPPMAPPAQGYGQYPPMQYQQMPYQQYPAMQQQQQVVVKRGGGVNHVLHLVLTVCTFGLWLPIWILDAMFHS